MDDSEFLTDTEIAAQKAPRQANAVDAQDLAGLDAEVAARDNALKASLRQGVMVNPDDVARTNALSKFTNIAPDVIDRNEKEVTAQARVSALQGVLASSPILARQMVDPEFAKLAHDDAENLSLFEKTMRTYLGASTKSGIESLLGTTAKVLDTIQPFTLSEQDAAVLFKDKPAELSDMQASAPMFLSRFARAMQQASEATMANINSDARAKYGDLKYATLDPDKAAYLSPIKVVGDAIQSLPTTLALAVSMYVTKGTAAQVEAQAIKAGMTPELARQAAMHAGAETMAKLGAATEGAAGFGQQAIQTREAADKITDATLATNPEYQRLIATGYSKEAARVALSAVAADAAGTAGGAADAVTNFYGGQFLGRMIGEGGALLKRIAKGFATEATTEAVQSGAEQIGQNAAVKKFLDHHQELLDGVAENIAQGFVVGGVMGGTFSAAAGRQTAVDRAAHDADALAQLMKIAGADKLRERSPEDFARFVQNAADESGTDSVLIDGATFAQAAQEKGLDLAATMPETAAQMEEAIALKGDVRIPLGELTAALPGTGLENTLLQHMRMSPDAPTLKETQDKQFVEDTQKAVEKAIGEFEFDSAQKSSGMVVEKELLGQLTTANRFTNDVNTAYARLMSTFYTVQAARLGTTAEDLYVKYPLRIQAESVMGAQLGQAQQPANIKSPAFKTWFKKSKVVEGGKPLVVYHGSGVNITKFDYQHTSKGHDQLGSGFYFTTQESDAKSYTTRTLPGETEKVGGTNEPTVHPVYLSLQKPLDADAIGTITAKQVREIIEMAPDFDTHLENFGDVGYEGQEAVMAKAANAYATRQVNILKQLNQLANDFFPNQVKEFNRAVQYVLGYDGVFSKLSDRTHWVAWFPEQIKSVNNSGGFDPKSGNIYMQSAPPPFYSELARQLAALKMNSGSPQAWKDALKGLVSKGVKQTEIEATGITDWLDIKEGKISKEEVTAFLATNGVRVGERILGGASSFEAAFGEWEHDEPDEEFLREQATDLYLDRAKERIAHRDEMEVEDLDPSQLRDAEEAAYNTARRDHFENSTSQTRSIDVDANGKTYKFMLHSQDDEYELFAPANQGNELDAAGGVAIPLGEYTRHRSPDDAQIEHAIRSWLGDTLGIDFDSEGAPFSDYTLPGGENYQVLLLTLPGQDAEGWGTAAGQPLFRSSHFDEENILAHIRTTERTDAEGKRVLFVEEIQSDWAQKGKKEGFVDTKRLDALDAKLKAEGQLSTEEAAEYTQLTNQEAMPRQYGGVPVAPFVTKTEAWVALALKRVITYAVANDFERVAWTTGEQQADRYSLSKTVSSIRWSPKPSEEGNKMIHIAVIGRHGMDSTIGLDVGKDGVVRDTTSGNGALTGKKLEDVIGKAAAEKIMGSADGKLEGEGLKIGGEGMKAFYDKIVPNVMNDVLKKINGGRVGTVDLGRVDGRDFTIAKRQIGGYTVRVGNEAANFSTREDAEAWAKERMGQKQPGFTITPKMREAAMQGLPLFQPDKWADEMGAALAGSTTQGANARGGITFDKRGPQHGTILTLLQNADLSTFLHESGHFYLEVMSDIASQPNAPTEIMGDMQRVLNWFGVPDLATWQQMDLEQKRPFHEQFARGFESYLFGGKAPNTELSGLFSRFRAWLINVYRQISALNVNVTDEVKQVFDRMLATNDEILQAEAARAYAPLFHTAEEMGATAEEWRSYQELGHAATQEAVDLMQTRSLRDMKWLSNAKSRALKKLQKEADAKRKGIQREVTEEVRAQPVYAATRFLTHGELPEGNLSNAERKALEDVAGQPSKLSLPDLRAQYGDGPAAPWRYLNTGVFGHVAAEDGLNPNMVAELFGYTSGDHLVRDILAAEPEANVIQGMTDQRMLERYGDLSSDAAVEQAANEAVHNEARGKFIATEVQALARAVGQRKVLIPAAKEFAATLIARKKVKDIKPTQYTSAETRAAKAAERAKSMVEKATEKRNQLVNHYAARAAFDALDEVEKSVAYLRRVGESKSIDGAYREQIQALLARFELRQITNKDAARRESLAAWVDEQRAQGLEPVIDTDLLDEMKRVPYREMPLEEFRGLVDAVKNIEHLGRLKHTLLALADKREFAAVVGEAAEAVETNAKRTLKAPLERTKWVKIKSGITEFFVLHRKFAMMMREMDGHQDNGVLWKLFVRPMNAAADSEAVMREAATKELQALLAPVLKAGRMSETRYVPEIKASLSREGRIMVALNMGNAGNLQRLLDGDGWTLEQATAILNTLTKTEMDFVQKIWDFIEGYKNEIGAQQRRITGVAPEWIEPRALQTIHGEYRGGYIPAKYDTSRSTRSLSLEAAQGVMDQWRAKRGAAKARDSFTKERSTKVVNRPLRKDFGVITQHATEVTHRLAWQEYLMDAQRLLRAPKIDTAIREHYGPEVLKALRDTIEDVAAGEIGAQNAFESAINYLRTGATIAGLGWRLTTAMLQPIGLTQSMARIGAKHVAAGLVEWLGDAVKMENTAKRISEKSNMMRLRSKTMQREISEIRNIVAGKNSVIEASFFYLIQKMQLVADIPTWLGQYHKAVEAGADEKNAVAQADQAVLDAQGGGQIKDLAAIQRGGPMLKLFTNFYSFFNTTYNLTSDAVGRTKWRDPVSVGRLAVDMLLLYSVPAVLGTLMKAVLHSGDDGQDDKKLVRQLIADQITYLFGTMVGLREVAGAAQTALGLPGDYQGPASVRVFAELARLGKQIEQGEVDEALLKAANNTAGILFHYPAGQIGATLDGIVTMANGKTNHPGALIVGSNKK